MIWIYAICINEAGLLERNQQIGFMCTIYSRLTRLIAWLGDVITGINQVARTLQMIRMVIKEETRVHCIPDYEDLVGVPLVESVQAVARLFERAWFRRAWVVQGSVLVVGGRH